MESPNDVPKVENPKNVDTDPVESISVTPKGISLSEDDGSHPDLVNLQSLTLEELENLVEARKDQVGADVFVARTKDKSSYEYQLASAAEDFSEEAARILAFVTSQDLKDDPNFTRYLKQDDGKLRLGASVLSTPKKVYGKTLSGKDALIAHYARKKRGVRLVPLYNSGITVTIRAPKIYEVAAFVQNASVEEISYGRSLGVQYFSLADFVIKRACIDFCVDLVLDCSLKDWSADDKSNLIKAISIADVNHLLMQVAALMYPDGYPDFRLACTNPECDAVTPPITIDPSTFLRTRFAAMPEDCVTFMEKNRKVSGTLEFKDLENYKKKLGFDGHAIEVDNYRYIFKVPSVDEYLTQGARVVAAIVSDIRGNVEGSQFVAVSTRSLLTYLPWIEKIEELIEGDEEEEPVVAFDIVGVEEKADTLTDLNGNAEYSLKFAKAMEELISKAQLTLVVYSPEPCDVCGTTPSTKSGMASLDPVHSFFILAFWLVKRHFLAMLEPSTPTE